MYTYTLYLWAIITILCTIFTVCHLIWVSLSCIYNLSTHALKNTTIGKKKLCLRHVHYFLLTIPHRNALWDFMDVKITVVQLSTCQWWRKMQMSNKCLNCLCRSLLSQLLSVYLLCREKWMRVWFGTAFRYRGSLRNGIVFSYFVWFLSSPAKRNKYYVHATGSIFFLPSFKNLLADS